MGFYDVVRLGAYATLAFASALVAPRVDRLARRHPGIRWAVILAGSLWITWWLVGDLRDARFALIDDHEILTLVGTAHRLDAARLVPLLRSHPEIGAPPSDAVRYRPAYFTLRYLEAACWGDDPRAWYAFRILLFFVSVVLGWSLLSRWLGAHLASHVLIFVLTQRYWMDVWGRLSTAEAYATPGFLLYLAGFVVVLGPRRRDDTARGWARRAGWVAMGLGNAVAAGSKENFLVLLPLTACLCVVEVRRGRFAAVGCACFAVIALLDTWVACVVVRGLGATRADVYQNPVAPGSRLALIPGSLTSMLSRKELVLYGLAWMVLSRAYAAGSLASATRARIRRGALLAAAMVVLYATQFVFYNGGIPKGTRYDFPAVTLSALLPWTTLPLLSDVSSRWHPGISGQLGLVRALVASCFTLLILGRSTSGIPDAVGRHVALTASLDRTVRALADTVRTEPTRPILVVGDYPTDLEAVNSAAVHFRHAGIANPLFFKYRGAIRPASPGPLFVKLDAQLASLEAHGDRVFGPLAQLDLSARPFVILISCEIPLDGLPTFGRVN